MTATLAIEKRLSKAEALIAPPLVPRSPIEAARAAGFDPDPWQQDLLEGTDRQVLVNVCRQGGKSTTTAILATHEAIYRPGSLVLLLSPSLRQSSELFKKCLMVYRALGRPVPADAENALSLDLMNGSRIVSLPGKEQTIRGYSGVSLLVIDEASRVDDALYRSVRPMLAVSGGRLISLSTPYGKVGWWHDAWEFGGDDWTRIRVTAAQCPRISADWLAQERRAMPWWAFQQEYCGIFTETDDVVFPAEWVSAALSDEVVPLFPGGLFHHAAV